MTYTWEPTKFKFACEFAYQTDAGDILFVHNNQVCQREIMTTSANSEDCHLLDWIEEVDDCWGARDVWQGESRTKLFLGVCFVTGWMPKDPKISTPVQVRHILFKHIH